MEKPCGLSRATSPKRPCSTPTRWTAALRWQDAGAEWLHIVDLDGARTGSTANAEAVSNIRAAVGVPIELGGGIRTAETAKRYFEMGIDRAILGTAAVADPELIESLVETWGDRVAVGLDARDGKLATDGWLEQSDQTALDHALKLRLAGVADFHHHGYSQGWKRCRARTSINWSRRSLRSRAV